MIEQIISRRLQITLPQVQGTVRLLRDGATIPFISRYRKEATGSLDELQVGAVKEQLERLTELDARRLQLFKHGPHVGVPAVAQHGWGPAIQRLGVELDQILGGIVRDAFLIEDRHIVVIPAADAAGAFQLALVHEEDAQPLLARAESRAAAGRTGADDEHVRFDERTERMS